MTNPDTPSVLLADDLPPPTPPVSTPPGHRAGHPAGRSTSHTAIIARQLGLPCVVAVGGLADVPEGAVVLVDGEEGTVNRRHPDPTEARTRVDAATEAAAALAGYEVRAHRAPTARRAGAGQRAGRRRGAGRRGRGTPRASACSHRAGLPRHSEEPPRGSRRRLRRGVRGLPPRQGRRPHAGRRSDKPLAFATPADEANPALGGARLRTTRLNPGILTRQLDAVKQAAEATGAAPWVMAPMDVSTVAEAATSPPRPCGSGHGPRVMVEVPSVALLADRFLQHLDFLSIGTNDLSQYTAGRPSGSRGDLADLTDPWQPALLRMVQLTAEAGQRWASRSGLRRGAADPLLACVLVGLGITSLSCAASSVAGVGANLGTVTLDTCRRAAEAALAADDPAVGPRPPSARSSTPPDAPRARTTAPR